jgi:soluble lytic murein transglycosylase-like protein
MRRKIKALLREPTVRLLVLLLLSLLVLGVISAAVNEAQCRVAAQPYILEEGQAADVGRPVLWEPTCPEDAPPAPVKYYDVPLSKEIQDHIFTACKEKNIPPQVVIAMIERESTYDVYDIGDDGRSFGLMQVQAKWHIKRMIALDSTDLFDPIQNVTVGIDYLSEQLVRYGGNMEMALTAYNGGHFKGTVTAYAKGVLARAAELEGDM